MTHEQNIGDAKAPTSYGTNPEEDSTRVFLRPIASPLALGFLALGGVTSSSAGYSSVGSRRGSLPTSRSP